MDKIDAHSKTVSELLDKVKYTIDYYQREYRWGTKQIRELLEDLTNKFLSNYEEGHEHMDVDQYSHYFLGSVVISHKGGENYLIDGQQRLTSLTLLLIYLHHLRPDRDDLKTLIYSERLGKKSYNLDIPERTECMDALYNGHSFDASEAPESVRTILARYEDVQVLFPSNFSDLVLEMFISWLLIKVDFVEIMTSSDEDAYTVFETMNDRGLNLSPTDMLKGYLLANIRDPQERNSAGEIWKQRLLQLAGPGKEEDGDFFKAWLRAKYAATIREGGKGSTNQDFEQIGTTFNKWVRDRHALIGLEKSDDFTDFVKERFARFSQYYLLARDAARTWTPGFEAIFFNAHHNFTLQFPLMLAPILPTDDHETAERKMRLVATYLDIYITRRFVNFRTLGYSAIVYTMFNLMKEIRDLSLEDLVQTLKRKLTEMPETMGGASAFYLHQQNRHYVHHLLARLTFHIEQQSGVASSFVQYVARDSKKPFEIEHIWSDHYRLHHEEFSSGDLFAQYRNHIGGLILLPGGINQSLNDAPYEKKVQAYFGQNLLAQSLNDHCYQNNPAFRAYIQASGLPFRPHAEFNKADLDARQELYQRLCEEIWGLARFDEVLEE